MVPKQKGIDYEFPNKSCFALKDMVSVLDHLVS